MNKRARFARFALLIAALLPVYFLIASLGARMGLWSPLTGFAKMTIGPALWLVAIVAALAIAALVATLFRAPRKGWFAALVALAIPLAVVAGLGELRKQSQRVPFIHDITTDPADPPLFSEAIVAAREKDGATNKLRGFDVKLGEYDEWKDNEKLANMTAGEAIAESYPDLKPLRVDAPPRLALLAAKEAMENRDFENVTLDAKAGRVEGTAVVFWYGFRDDVIARVRADGDGSVVDFRSISRVGMSDLGVNAKRIADLRRGVSDLLADKKLRAELDAPDEDEDGDDSGMEMPEGDTPLIVPAPAENTGQEAE